MGFADQYANQSGDSGGDFPSAPPSIIIPREYQANSDLSVPGLENGFTHDPTLHPNGGHAAQLGLGGADVQATPTSMRDGLYNLLVLGQTDSNGTRSLQEQMIRAGYLNPDPRRGNFAPGSVASGDSTYNAYAKLLNDAIVTGQSIFDILAHRQSDKQNSTGQRYWNTYLGVTGQKATSKSYTSSNVNLSSAGDAYAVATNEYQRLLGRDPNKKEVAALHAALNAYEKAHPTVSSHTVVSDPTAGTYDRGGTTSGGVSAGDREMVADSRISQTAGKELGQVQSDRLVQVFEQMLGGGNG